MDLVGGYYDAGDHIKFGFPMAFAMTMISWSVIEFEREIYICNQLEKALDAIHWGTDYLIKAHTQANVLWSQVCIVNKLSNEIKNLTQSNGKCRDITTNMNEKV